MFRALNGRNWQRARRAKFFAIQIADNSSDISNGLGVGGKAVILLNALRASVVSRQGFGNLVAIVHHQFTQIARSTFNLRARIPPLPYPIPPRPPPPYL